MGLTGNVLIASSISLSAMMYLAAMIDSDGSKLSTIGIILTLVGAAGAVAPAFVFSMPRSSEDTHHTLNRQPSDLHNGIRSILQETLLMTQRVLSSATTRPPPH